MSSLEKILPEFRNGARIRISTWPKNQYIYKKGNEIYNEDGEISKFLDGYVMTCDLWEFYQEHIDWNYIIENSCLCWFWDDENDKNFIATLEAFEIDICVTRFKSKNGAVWHNCRPVRKDEVTFYEDKKDVL